MGSLLSYGGRAIAANVAKGAINSFARGAALRASKTFGGRALHGLAKYGANRLMQPSVQRQVVNKLLSTGANLMYKQLKRTPRRVQQRRQNAAFRRSQRRRNF